MEKTVLLRRIEDDQGLRQLHAILAENGQVMLVGQDIGDGVEAIFGEREYEYGLTIQAKDVPVLLAALDGEGDILSALEDYFGRQEGIAPATFLDKHGVPYKFWSRMGD